MIVHACFCLSVFISAARFVSVWLLRCLETHRAQNRPKWPFVYHRVCVWVRARALLICWRVCLSLLIPLFWECCGWQEVGIMERAEECSVFVLQSLSNHHTAAETRGTFASTNTSLTCSLSLSNNVAQSDSTSSSVYTWAFLLTRQERGHLINLVVFPTSSPPYCPKSCCGKTNCLMLGTCIVSGLDMVSHKCRICYHDVLCSRFWLVWIDNNCTTPQPEMFSVQLIWLSNLALLKGYFTKITNISHHMKSFQTCMTFFYGMKKNI